MQPDVYVYFMRQLKCKIRMTRNFTNESLVNFSKKSKMLPNTTIKLLTYFFKAFRVPQLFRIFCEPKFRQQCLKPSKRHETVNLVEVDGFDFKITAR